MEERRTTGETMVQPDEVMRLLNAARDVARNAYAPYSKFPVGAAVLTVTGEIFVGCNVENASYPLSICAERVAIANAVAAGYRQFRAVAVTAPKLIGVTPCGGCRQVLNEFKATDGNLIVIVDGAEGPELIPLSMLLPRDFGPPTSRA